MKKGRNVPSVKFKNDTRDHHVLKKKSDKSLLKIKKSTKAKICPLVGGVYDGTHINTPAKPREILEYEVKGKIIKYLLVHIESNGESINFYRYQNLTELQAMQMILDKYHG